MGLFGRSEEDSIEKEKEKQRNDEWEQRCNFFGGGRCYIAGDYADECDYENCIFQKIYKKLGGQDG